MVTLQKHLKARATAEELFVIIAPPWRKMIALPPQVTAFSAGMGRDADIHK